MEERCPARNVFHAALGAVEKLCEETQVIFVDLHAEVTSEWIGMGWHLYGKAGTVFGSHSLAGEDC